MFKLDQLSLYSPIDHLDLKLTTELIIPALFMSRIPGELYQRTVHEVVITQTCPCNIQQIFHGCKNDNFQMKFFDIFLIFDQNIDCGYTLEPPQRGGSNEYPQSMFWSKNKKKCIPL